MHEQKELKQNNKEENKIAKNIQDIQQYESRFKYSKLDKNKVPIVPYENKLKLPLFNNISG